eukprot:COSAG01_NODE_862_length_13058_cov_6.823366_14_plen_540_part_00
MVVAVRQRFEDRTEGVIGGLKIVMMVCMLAYLAHIVACMWYMVGDAESENTRGWLQEFDDKRLLEVAWLSSNGQHNTTSLVDTQTKWLAAFYWSCTTITSVGYGDVSPTTRMEMTLAVIAQLIGTLSFGFVIGMMGSLVQKQDMLDAAYRKCGVFVVPTPSWLDRFSFTVSLGVAYGCAKPMCAGSEMSMLRNYMKVKRLPLGLRRRVRAHYLTMHETSAVYDQTKLLSKLPPGIRTDVLTEVYGQVIGRMSLFRDLNVEEMQMMYQALRPRPVVEGTVVFNKGEVALEMYFIMSGVVARKMTDTISARPLRAGSFFGEEVWLGTSSSVTVRRTMTAIALEETELAYLSKDILQHLESHGLSRVRERVMEYQYMRQRREREREEWVFQGTSAMLELSSPAGAEHSRDEILDDLGAAVLLDLDKRRSAAMRLQAKTRQVLAKKAFRIRQQRSQPQAPKVQVDAQSSPATLDTQPFQSDLRAGESAAALQGLLQRILVNQAALSAKVDALVEESRGTGATQAVVGEGGASSARPGVRLGLD